MYTAGMFPFGATTSDGGIDPDKEREPPPPPTLVYFPQWDVSIQMKNKWTLDHMPDFYKSYSRVQKPADVKLSHLECLNLTFNNDVPLDTIIPSIADAITYLPPASWNRVDSKGSLTPDKSSAKPGLLNNGSKAPDQDVYIKLAKELVCENEDAFRVMDRRRPRPGRPATHLAHFRRFWVQLQSMSMYWDDSLDHYYEVDVPAPSPKTSSKLGRASVFSLVKEHHQPAVTPSSPGTVKRYKGRRMGTGERMPDHFRIDAVRQFLDPIVHAFGCQVANPRKLPQLEIKSLLVPVTQTALVWRTPIDKAEARRGYLEGPVVGLQCRGETDFASSRHESIVDLAREIAGLFLLAGERAREGKPKRVPGVGKWYTVKPRWGGGPGGEFGEAEGNTDTTPAVNPPARKHSTPNITTPRHRSEEEIWRELTPGPGIWEPRVTYMAIGKSEDDKHDQVFMVSALFHHISIVKLRVHSAYMDYMTLGAKPDAAMLDMDEFYPVVSRTKWYDLLLPSDRLEAFRGIWGILSYNMRALAIHHETSQAAPIRRKSEITSSFPFRKKSYVASPSDGVPPTQRRSSVFF